MRRHVTLALAASLGLATLAAVQPADYTPVLNGERVYVQCGGTTLSNVEGGTPFGWDTTAPTASVQEGAGCGTADAVLSEDASETVLWEGTHTGNLDALTLDLYMIDAGIVRLTHLTDGATANVPQGDDIPSLAFTEIWANVSITIDGYEAGWIGEAKMTAERTNSDVTARLQMTLTGIDMLAEDQAGEHTIRVELTTADYYNGDSGLWAWGTTEVPAGLEFSPAEEDHAEFVVESF